MPTLFTVTGTVKMTSKCCGYGTDAGDTAVGFDCVLIPGASKLATAAGLAQTLKSGGGFGFCGGELGTIADGAAAATICCKYNVIYTRTHLQSYVMWNSIIIF